MNILLAIITSAAQYDVISFATLIEGEGFPLFKGEAVTKGD